MAKNVNVSNLDSSQIAKLVVDSEHDAVRVIQAAHTETQIEISAEDNDSVQAVCRQRISEGELQCADLRRFTLFIDCASAEPQELLLEASPLSEGDVWFLMARRPLKPQERSISNVIELCASRIRASAPQTKIIIVGQS